MTLVLPLGLALGLGFALGLIPVGILLAFVVVRARAVVVVVMHLTHSTHRDPLCRGRDSQQGSDEECRAQEFQFLHRSLLKWYACSYS